MDKIIVYRELLNQENLQQILFPRENSKEIYQGFLRDNKDYIEGLPPHVFRYSKFYKDYDASNTVVNIKAPILIIVG